MTELIPPGINLCPSRQAFRHAPEPEMHPVLAVEMLRRFARLMRPRALKDKEPRPFQLNELITETKYPLDDDNYRWPLGDSALPLNNSDMPKPYAWIPQVRGGSLIVNTATEKAVPVGDAQFLSAMSEWRKSRPPFWNQSA